MECCIRSTGDGTGIFIDILVKPNSSSDGMIGVDSWRNRLAVAVTAKAQDGKANKAVCRLIEHALGSGPVMIIKGMKSSQKTVEVKGITMDLAKASIKAIVDG